MPLEFTSVVKWSVGMSSFKIATVAPVSQYAKEERSIEIFSAHPLSGFL